MIYDLPNLLFIIIFAFSFYRLGYIPSWICFLLIIGAFFPFLFNDFIFPENYMPDQKKYFHIANSIRGLDLNYIQYSRNVEVSSWILSLVPLPFIETINSLGFINKFIYTLLVVYLYSSKKIRGIPLFILIFYPSLLMYTSLSLRDTLILLFMLLSVIYFIEKKFSLSLFFLVFLSIIKFQNAFILILYFLFHSLFTPKTYFYKLRYFIILSFFPLLIFYINDIILLIDFYRAAMYREDGGEMSLYIPISNVNQFVILSLLSAPYFLMKPFFWEASSFLQLIQSIENLFILLTVILYLKILFRINKRLTIKWLVFLVLSFSIYGVVVFNYGTAVRYKFPFLVLFFVCSYYEIHFKNKFK